ncbi:unnamed protein product, partial [Notodromas monacha]
MTAVVSEDVESTRSHSRRSLVGIIIVLGIMQNKGRAPGDTLLSRRPNAEAPWDRRMTATLQSCFVMPAA